MSQYMLKVSDLFGKVGLTPSVPLKWGMPIKEKGNGVYVVSLSSSASENYGTLSNFQIRDEVFAEWINRSPDLNVVGAVSKGLLEEELNKYWKPNQNILYIGESSSENNQLSGRLNQFYQHQVGWKGPHTGGYWIKLLAELNDLYVYYSICSNPRDTEFKMLMHFIEQTTGKNFYELGELGVHLPFANLKVDFQKKHLVANAVPKKKRS